MFLDGNWQQQAPQNTNINVFDSLTLHFLNGIFSSSSSSAASVHRPGWVGHIYSNLLWQN
jgi:hypothetical protein